MKALSIPQEFMEKFAFDPAKECFLGCERELFLTDAAGNIKPLASMALEVLPSGGFGFELSACQLEMRIGPVKIDGFDANSKWAYSFMLKQLSQIGIYTSFLTVAPEDIPLDVYPDPSGRYQRITNGMPKNVLSAACRVTGTHFHIGMPDHETALRVYNRVIEDTDRLCHLGNLTNGERLSIYHIMAKDNRPIPYEDWGKLYDYYHANGYDLDPRQCWHLIRISVHGTIEFRMFDNTNDLDLITSWGTECLNLCRSAIG